MPCIVITHSVMDFSVVPGFPFYFFLKKRPFEIFGRSNIIRAIYFLFFFIRSIFIVLDKVQNSSN